MRVLHLLKTSVGATWALRQVRHLTRLGAEVHVTVPPGPLASEYEACGATVHRFQFGLPTSSLKRAPGLFRDFRALVSDLRPDLVHSHFFGTTLTMRLALGPHHPTPRIFQVPGPLHLEHPFFRLLEMSTAGHPDFWIGSCKWTVDRYRRSGIHRDRVFLSYYGLEVESFVAQPPGTLRRELDLDSESKLVGMVAYMYAPKRYLGQRRGLKGHEDLIDALALIRKTNPEVVGVFIGGAWGQARAHEERVRAYGRARLGRYVHFLGTRSDIPDLYADLDVVAHPSHSENVGGAAESLLLGVPTITTNVGGFPDVVIPGETGWLVPPRRPELLAEAIQSALRDPTSALELANNGQRKVRILFDVRRTAEEILQIYSEVLRGSGPGHRRHEANKPSSRRDGLIS